MKTFFFSKRGAGGCSRSLTVTSMLVFNRVNVTVNFTLDIHNAIKTYDNVHLETLAMSPDTSNYLMAADDPLCPSLKEWHIAKCKCRSVSM